jgi:hypothetical protein
VHHGMAHDHMMAPQRKQLHRKIMTFDTFSFRSFQRTFDAAITHAILSKAVDRIPSSAN